MQSLLNTFGCALIWEITLYLHCSGYYVSWELSFSIYWKRQQVWLCFTAISQNVHNVMKQFVYRELFFAAKTFFAKKKKKRKNKDSTLLTKK